MKLRRPEQYATLARVRKHEADQRAQELSRARNALKNLELQRAELEAYQRRVLDEAGRQTLEPVASRLGALFHFERHLGRLADAKSTEIRSSREDVEARREAFEEAVRKKRIVERLVERAGEQFRERLARQEQRQHDEAASIQFAQRALIERRNKRTEEQRETSRNTNSGPRGVPSGHHRARRRDG